MPAVGRVRSTNDEARRYQMAAEQALDQLQWCIRYLRTIKKTRIANALAKNHETIRNRMRGVED